MNNLKVFFVLLNFARHFDKPPSGVNGNNRRLKILAIPNIQLTYCSKKKDKKRAIDARKEMADVKVKEIDMMENWAL